MTYEKIWVTTYALTKGIVVFENVEVEDPRFPDMLVITKGSARIHFHGKGSNWHTDRESAVRKAVKMQSDKIKSIQKQIARIEKLKFDKDNTL